MEAIHVFTASCIVPLIIVSDIVGARWMHGKTEVIDSRILLWLHRIMWIFLATMILSGGVMFLEYKDYLLSVPAFYVKMGFVATLCVNAIFIGRIMHVATERPFASLSQSERLPLYISGSISLIAWIGTFVAAFQLGL